MDIFNSPWLIKMLAKSSKSPRQRLLNLFDILDDWLKAPNFEKTATLHSISNRLLITYCIDQAIAIGAENPDILAEHIVLIAHSAAQQAIEQPESSSLLHAKKAAQALIQAQTQKTGLLSSIRESRPALYGIAASMLIVIGVAAIWVPMLMHNQQQMTQQTQQTKNAIATSLTTQNKPLTAIDASRMYAKYEQMRQGTCQFPEALLIPDKHKSIYLENVVGGKVPTDLDELSIANFYLEKVRCNFTPMLMAVSK
jgi:hypothetical protein